MFCVGCANNDGKTTTTTTTASQPQIIQPGEQAPLADVGQKNFGVFQNVASPIIISPSPHCLLPLSIRC